MYLFSKTEYYGAQTTLHLCFMDDNQFKGGAYYYDCREGKMGATVTQENRYLYMRYSRELINTFGSDYNLDLKFI